MLVITPALRKHMTDNFAVKADASDDDFRKSVSDAVAGGKLTAAQLVELTTVKQPSEAEMKVKGMIADALNPVLEAIGKLTPGAGAKALELGGGNPSGAGGAAAGSDPAKAYGAAGVAGSAAGSSRLDEPTRIRVKSALEQFDDTRTAATWDKSTNPVVVKALRNGRIDAHMENAPYTFDMPSERSKAIAGIWFKRSVLGTMPQNQIQPHHRLKEYEKDILKHIAHECRFVGGGFGDGYEYEGEKLLNEMHIKAVLDDSTSGGLEAVPIEYDANVILTPLLSGELFPFVSITNVSRRRIEATKIGNPTMAWGTAEGTAISLFNTDSFISAFDNTIFPISGSIELGRDFLADSPVAVGQIVMQRFGERFKYEMDDVIAMGNGTNRPEGVFVTSGVTTVTPAGGSGAAQTIGDYESLRFGVAKEFREEAGNRAMYIGTDTSYSRARGIPVDSPNDARRVFGIMDQEDYMVFQRRYAVNNNSLTNAKIGYFCMNRYRMYRRLGLETRTVTEDWGLARANKIGIVVRARFGGALELAAAGAKITAGQA